MCVCVFMCTSAHIRESRGVCPCVHACVHTYVYAHFSEEETPAYTCIQKLEVDVWCLPQLLST